MKRFILVVMVVCLAHTASAQWVTDTSGVTTANNVGVGVASHANMKLRIADTPADSPGGKTQISFGTTTATWWAFRLNTANDLFLDRQDNGWKEGVVFAKNGHVGIGVASPSARLHVMGGTALIGITTPISTGDALTAGIGIGAQRFASAPNVTMTMARGTEAAPTAVAATDDTGRVLFRGYDGATPVGSARISGVVEGTVASGSVPQAITFRTGDTSSPAERMRIDANGEVGIGTSTPAFKLHVHNTATNTTSMHAQADAAAANGATQVDTAAQIIAHQTVAAGAVANGTVLGLRTSGWVLGAGETEGAFGAIVSAGISGTNSGIVDQATGLRVIVTQGSGTGLVRTGYGMYINNINAASGYGIYQAGTDDQNLFLGKVRVGGASAGAEAMYVAGDLKVTGNVTGAKVFNAVYQDIAEWVPATSDLVPGTVVILHPEHSNEVMASHSAYDSSVAGVVSAQPGVVLGVEAANKEQIATTGRVKVRVDARKNAIRIGDLLVTSDMPGTAMKSVPVDFNGRSFHQPGTIIGKALEPLEGGVGEILVLLSMQ